MKKYTVAKIERVVHAEIKRRALIKQRGVAEEANRVIRLGLALDSCTELNRVRQTLEQRYSWQHMALTDFIDTAPSFPSSSTWTSNRRRATSKIHPPY